MGFRHIISTLRFSRLTAFFLILQTMLACAILTNVLFFIAQQMRPMLRQSGIDERSVLYVDNIGFPMTVDPTSGNVFGGTRLSDLRDAEARLRAMPGVESVSINLGMPFTQGFDAEGTWHTVDGKKSGKASLYLGDHLIQAWGLELTSGRDFTSNEVTTIDGMQGTIDAPVAIIGESLARKLFPEGRALGQRIVMGTEADDPRPVVIGVVRHLAGREMADLAHAHTGVIMPIIPGDGFMMANLVVRAQTSQRERVLRALPSQIKRSLHLTASAQLRIRSFEDIRTAYFSDNRNMILLLLGVTVAVIAITVIGIMGMTGFWVQRRRRQIGIRRALGATRQDILHGFMLENLIVVGVGIVLGMIAAYIGNIWLMKHLEMARLPLLYLPAGAAVLCLLGQLGVLSPALRAAAVPPVVATRSA